MRRYFWDTDRNYKPHCPSFCSDAVNQNIDETEPFAGPVARAAVVTLNFFLNRPVGLCGSSLHLFLECLRRISPAVAAVSHIYQDML